MPDSPKRKFRHLTVDGVTINVPSLPEAVSSIVSAAQHGDNFSVCTLNLDHVVQLQQRPDFRAAYRRARFVTADGFPIVMLSRLLGTPIKRTTGADLVEPLCQAAQKNGLSIFLMGSNGGVLGLDYATARPVALVESGPVGGGIGAAAYADALGIQNLISFDMGGTTAKCALVESGRFEVKTSYYVGGYARGFDALALSG